MTNEELRPRYHVNAEFFIKVVLTLLVAVGLTGLVKLFFSMM